jgi:hypothetical protein
MKTARKQGAITMHDITTIQEALVAAHIADLQREAAALGAERDRDHLREHAAARATSSANDHVADLPSRRVRIGRRLMAFGEAVAGTTRPTGAASRPVPATSAGIDDPCGDGQDQLAPAI